MGENQIQVTFSDMLTDKLTVVQEALPNNFNKARFVQNALAVINGNTELQSKPKEQIMTGLLRGAYLGLDFLSNECYLVPYGNTVNFQLSYIGSIKFVKKYSIRPIKDIYAKSVRVGDKFQASIKDGHPTLDFEPLPFNSEEIMGVFALVLYEDGGMEYETMTKEEVNTTRQNYSRAANSNAWKKSWEEMAKKTVLRRLCKHIECDFESIEAHEAWDIGGDFEVKKPVKGEIVEDPFAKQDEEAIDVDAKEVEAEQIDLPEFLKGDEA